MSKHIEESQKNRQCSLHVLVLETNPELPLSEEEFQSLKQAKSCLSSAIALEENYDLLLGNYRELELEAMSAAVSNMTAGRQGYNDFFEIRTSINRRVVNLLSATRMYLDQYPQLLKKVGAEPKSAKEVASAAYDTFFEYRFMEALRNHAQHAGLAVHGVTMGMSWLPPNDPKQLQFSITPYALKSALEEGPAFKRAVLDQCSEQVDIIPAARIHVGGISSVHRKVRELIKPFVQEARSLFEDAIARHESEAKERYSGLTAIAKENGAIVEKISILLDWDDIRQLLVKKNRPVENLGKRFFTSQSRGRAS